MWHFLKYLLKSNTTHGVHTPFVFDFLEQAVYNENRYYSYSKLITLHQEQYPKASLKRGLLFFRMANYFNIKNIFITASIHPFYKDCIIEARPYGHSSDIKDHTFGALSLAEFEALNTNFENAYFLILDKKNIAITAQKHCVILYFYHFSLVIFNKNLRSEKFWIWF